MSQEENINSSPAVCDIQREYEIISKNTNILLNRPIKLSLYNSLLGKRSKRYFRPPNAFIIFRKVVTQELGEHCKNFPPVYITKFIVQKWKELPSDVKERYREISIDFDKYYSHRTDPPTYRLIKF
ncbi:hypothetical protein RclHR1_13120002 [Rhizophagus clarus]|uniref:HMG box domain-containing protein n=1 Tax=Rhizophagus clarus TaxID=94130 RepID=A0A2Z6QPT2_9GLOM|nr:hypothetical protein RclHR1_13120002 [Rhizophagus clarus]